MNEIRPKITIGDSLYGTWTYIDDDGKPIVITQDMGFSSSIELNGSKYPVLLVVLDQNEYPGQISYLVQTTGWTKGIAEMDMLVVSGIYREHTPKYCFIVSEGVT
ncbi:hypothetical protein [Acinetobacter higginsii]|uniref:hypothetical protein n=1 Tax=Acinetobacter higginsii TaxID=70347 RepID=UPI001F4B152C|nr:hypothetical protein [Acinetobacter higginsii]MCH7381358.1 hypothetical protein [Acinetobacter higginsii]